MTTEQRITKVLLAIRNMDYDHRSVLRSRFGLTNGGSMLSLTEIGRIKGINRHTVRKIEKEALRELVKVFESDDAV